MTFIEFKEAIRKEITQPGETRYFDVEPQPDNLPVSWYLGMMIGEYLDCVIENETIHNMTVSDLKGLSKEELANKIIFILDSVKDSHLKHDG